MEALERDATLEERATGAETGSHSLNLAPENTVAMDADGTLTLECGMKGVRHRLAKTPKEKTAYLAELHKLYGKRYWGITAAGIALYRAPLFPPVLRFVEETRIRTLVRLVKNQDASVIEENGNTMTLNPLLLFTTHAHLEQTDGKNALILSRGISNGISYFLDNPENPTLAKTVEECTKMNLPQQMMEDIFEAFQERSLTPRMIMEIFGYSEVHVAAHNWVTETESATGKQIFTGEVEPNDVARELFGGRLVTMHRKLQYPCSLYMGDLEERRYLLWNFMRKANFINVEDKPFTKVEHFLRYVRDTADAIGETGDRYRDILTHAQSILRRRMLLSSSSLPNYASHFLDEHQRLWRDMLERGQDELQRASRNLINYVNYTTGISNQELLVAARAHL